MLVTEWVGWERWRRRGLKSLGAVAAQVKGKSPEASGELVESSGSGGVNVNTSLTPVSCSLFLPSFSPSFFLSLPSLFFHYFEFTI